MEVGEKIVCAAIWYKDFPLIIDQKIPVGFQRPKNCDEGMVFCGLRHHNCMYQAISISGKYEYQLGREVQGFLTTKNRFVDRNEGAEIHIANDGTLEFTSELFSEDLY